MTVLIEVGTKVRFIKVGKVPDVTVGNVYEIAGRDYDNDIYFIDDAQEKNFAFAVRDGRNGKAHFPDSEFVIEQ